MNPLALAWRNLWRNRRRTLITAGALGFGVFFMVATIAWMDGMFDRMVVIATGARTGHAQVHAKGWFETRDETLLLSDAAAVAEQARGSNGVVAATVRAHGTALLAVGDRSRGVALLGVDPRQEPLVTDLQRGVKAGALLDPEASTAEGTVGQVVIGRQLAAKLDVEVGTRLVLTGADIETGEARAEAVRVTGLVDSGDPGIDRSTAIVPLAVAQRLMGIGAAGHEVALRLDADLMDKAALEALLAPLATQHPEASVRAWRELLPMIDSMIEMQDTWIGVFVGIIFFVIAFGVINTMTMSMAERWHEMGLLRALGTSPLQLAAMVLTEAFWLGVVGALPGALGGWLLAVILEPIGIPLGEQAEFIVTFHEPVRPHPDLGAAIAYALLFTALTVLVSAMSAWRVSRVDPIEAMRA